MMIKNILSKVALLNLGIVLSFNSAQAMEKDDAMSPVLPIQQKNIEDPPFEDKMFVLEHLSVQDLGRCAQVCKGWNEILSDGYIWEKVAKKHALSGGILWVETYFNTHWKEIMKSSLPKDKKVKDRERQRSSDPWNDKPYNYNGVLAYTDGTQGPKSFEEIRAFNKKMREHQTVALSGSKDTSY